MTRTRRAARVRLSGPTPTMPRKKGGEYANSDEAFLDVSAGEHVAKLRQQFIPNDFAAIRSTRSRGDPEPVRSAAQLEDEGPSPVKPPASAVARAGTSRRSARARSQLALPDDFEVSPPHDGAGAGRLLPGSVPSPGKPGAPAQLMPAVYGDLLPIEEFRDGKFEQAKRPPRVPRRAAA